MPSPKTTSAIFALLILALPTLSQAGGDAESIRQDFYRNAESLPRKLLANGYQTVGAVDVNSLLSRIEQQQVAVKVVGNVAHQQQMGGFEMERDSAEWQPGTISVNGPKWLKTANSAKPMLTLHEIFGAQGISDDSFDCSGSIWMITNPDARRTLNAEELNRFEGYANKSCVQARFGGGSTGVGGGGDDYPVRARMTAAQKGLKLMHSGSHDQGLDYLESTFYQGFEINRHPKKAFTAESFLSSVHLDRTPIVESIRVTYKGESIPEDPKNGWTYDAKSNSVIFHGRAIPKDDHSGMMESPGVTCQWAD